MEQQVVDMVVDNRSFKEKAEAKLYELKGKAKQAADWVVTHPTETAAGIALGLGVLTEGRRIFDRVKDVRDESISRRTCYCNDVNGYVRLKHELNYKENRELRDLMNQGYTRFEALDKMRLLK